MTHKNQENYQPGPELDDNGQPHPRFHAENNREKSFHDLIGILHGITADQEINGDEVRWLNHWLRHAASNLNRDGDYLDLVDAVEDILCDGLVTQDEKDDLLNMVNDILRYRDRGIANEKQATQRLLGLMNGIAADRRLNTDEVLTLRAWLDTVEGWTDIQSFNTLRQAVKTALSDGEFNPDNPALLNAIRRIVGEDIGHAMQLFDDDQPIAFERRGFCFSGTFNNRTRRQCIELIVARGGVSHKNVTRQTDYLVVGGISSRDWVYSSFGRKLEKALRYRKEHGLLIISQNHWEKHLLR